MEGRDHLVPVRWRAWHLDQWFSFAILGEATIRGMDEGVPNEALGRDLRSFIAHMYVENGPKFVGGSVLALQEIFISQRHS